MDLIVVFCAVSRLYLCLRCCVSVSLPNFRWIKIYIKGGRSHSLQLLRDAFCVSSKRVDATATTLPRPVDKSFWTWKEVYESSHNPLQHHLFAKIRVYVRAFCDEWGAVHVLSEDLSLAIVVWDGTNNAFVASWYTCQTTRGTSSITAECGRYRIFFATISTFLLWRLGYFSRLNERNREHAVECIHICHMRREPTPVLRAVSFLLIYCNHHHHHHHRHF